MRCSIYLIALVACAFLLNCTNADVLPIAPGDVPTPCTPDTGDDTSTSTDCGPDRYCALDPAYSSDNNSYYCLHKTLANNPGVSGRDVVALLLIAGCCFLAAMGGIGGGGLLFPLIVMVMNFTPKEAIVLSHAGVFGNCLGQATFYISNAWCIRKQRSHGHENEGRSDDDSLYQTVSAAVLVILPGLLAGGSTALTLQGLVPSTAILILALFTLSLGVVKTTMKAVKMWKEEEDAALGQADLMSSSADENESAGFEEEDDDNESAFQYKAMDSRVAESSGDIDNEEGADTEQIGASVESMESAICCRGILRCTVEKLIFSCWVLDAATFLAQKSSSIAKCSAAYFVVVFLPVLIGIIFIWRGRVLLMHRSAFEHTIADQIHDSNREHSVGEEEGDAWVENMQAATTTTSEPESGSSVFNVLVWWLPLAAFVVGLISALLGIGGGEILGPTLLLLNMNPLHSSTTTSVVALLNSGTNTLHNFTAGLIISPGYFASIWSVGLVSGGSGRSFSMILSKRSGKNSIIAFSLSALLGIATALVVIELVKSPPEWESEGVC